jgi:hypothetical protein
LKSSSSFDYYLIHALAVVAVSGAIAYLSLTDNRLTAAPTVRYNTYLCTVPGEGGGSLRILAYMETQAVRLVDALCSDPVVRALYSEVHATWRRNNISDSQILFDQQFDLLAAKPEMIEREDVPIFDSYVPIARYADNTSRFVSIRSTPELTQAYFDEKRLGLVDSSQSISGHVVPRQRLHNAGIDESGFAILYFHGHAALYRALIQGEVDVIGSGIQLPAGGPKHYVLPIQGGLPGPRWYLHPRHIDTPLHCRISSALRESAMAVPRTYENSIELLRPCSF